MRAVIIALALAAALVAEEKPVKPQPPTDKESARLANLDAARNRAAALYFRKLEENRARLADAQRQLDEEAKRIQIDAEKAEREYTAAVDAVKKAAGAEKCVLEENARWNCAEPAPKK